MMKSFPSLPLLFAVCILSLCVQLTSAEGMSAQASFSKRCEAAVQCIVSNPSNETCGVVPVAPSKQRFLNDTSFSLKLLREGVYLYTEIAYNTLVLKSGRHITLIDFPLAAGSAVTNDSGLLRAIPQVLNGTIPYRVDMVYSHAHFDHIGTSRLVFNFLRRQYPSAKILVWGTLETRKLIRDSKRQLSVKPNIIVGRRGRALFMSPTLMVRLDIIGGHTQSDLRVYIPPSRAGGGIVMFVDVVFPGFAAPFNFAITQDLRQYIKSHQRVLRLRFDTFVPGHIGLGNRTDVVVSMEYAKSVLEAAKQAVASVTLQQQIDAGIGRVSDPNAAEFGNFFFPFVSVLRPLQIEACFRIVVEKWGCRLGGTDLVARGHCFTALQFLDIEL